MKKVLLILTLIIVGGLTFSCSTDEYDASQETSAKQQFNKESDLMRVIPNDSTAILPNNTTTEPISTNLEGDDNGGGTIIPPKR
ncbi:MULTISPECIES: hypothetical protein [Flavobacterium]|uniref:hypothetical protein n=1 Tax=Flavobacterium TaxID=237 RepID=UPI00086AC7DC|nr:MULTISPECIES: hypothetical protein [Flavobacterium]MBN9283549.1 hypothetical protein [Flavobacterium sp.]ODS86483.1 MAG: hypothetical protein ABS44_13205 [Chryseobacterium sp. SCN 40-13]OJV69336.1 MAG: hypothetical protein BGO42_13260 [Flavobacterium sp. 40-81]